MHLVEGAFRLLLDRLSRAYLAYDRRELKNPRTGLVSLVHR